MAKRLIMDKKRLLDDLIKGFILKHEKSEAIFKKASHSLIVGGSHNLRLFSPFPFYDVQSSGSKVWDVDGIIYVDFWSFCFEIISILTLKLKLYILKLMNMSKN